MAGFVENVNTLANAVALSTGSVVEDTGIARDEAVAASVVAKASETLAGQYSDVAHSWADKGHNNPVIGSVTTGTAEYSAYHWAVESALKVGDPLINDAIINGSYTWSSTKLDTALNGKASIAHTHAGIYEPAFVKKTAFNKDFAGSGAATTVAKSDHLHSGVYELVIPVKKTGFNLDVGTASGTLAEGDHNHSALYMPKVTELSAYNKAFVVDTNAPLSTEVPRGNHTHKAVGVSYDNTGNKVVTSTTVQGGMQQLDSFIGSVTVAEKCFLVAGMTDATYSVPFTTIGIPTVVNAGTTIKNSKNAIYSGGIKVNYAVAPTKLVQGMFDSSVALTAAANTVYALRLSINGVVDMASKVVARLGSATSPAGTFNLSLGCFVAGLSNADVLAIALVNETSTTSVVMSAMSMSFSGEPEGSLVISGTTVLHNDVTGRDTANQHPTTAIYDTATGTPLNTLLAAKADLVGTPVTDNVLVMDSAGDIADSGISKASVLNKMDKVAAPVVDTIVVMDSAGNSKNGTKLISDLALKGGSTANKFLVMDATLATEAVSKGQMDGLSTVYSTIATMSAHTGATNPHSITPAMIGAAPTSHTHTIANVTDLQTTLDGKYAKVVTPVTGNVAKFGAGGVLVDGGTVLSSTDLTMAIGNINSPLLDMPLKNSLAMKSGVGSATFTRASTATYIDRYGVLKGVAIDEPRFEKEGYLNEGSSTNLLTYSEAFTGWGFNACSQAGDATARNPYGTLGFSKFTASGASAWFNSTTGTLTQPTPTIPITISFFVKEGTTTRIRLRVTEGGLFQNDVVINIADGTKVVDALTFAVSINYLANGIKRIKVTYTPIITHTAFGFRFYMQNNSGDSTANDYMWFSGAQLEALPFASSYIPTLASTVTRAADILNITRAGNMPNLEANGEFSLACDFDVLGSSGTNQWIWGLYASSLNSVGLYASSSLFLASVASSSYDSNSVTFPGLGLPLNTKVRTAQVINNSGNTAYRNGVDSSFDADTDNRITDTCNSIDTIRIGSYTPSSIIACFYGHISNFRIWEGSLTAQEVALA